MVLEVGFATFIGVWGVGVAILQVFRVHPPLPWNHVISTLLGLQALSLTVQIAGMTEIASRTFVSTIWWSFVSVGSLMLLIRARRIRPMLVNIHKSSLLPTTIIG